MLPVLVAPLPWGVGSALHRGFAASFPPGTEVARVQVIGSLEDRVASVELARRARGWERCIVAGHSMATLVALRAALDFPLQVAGLVLVGGAAGPAALREGLWRPGHAKHADWLAAYQRLRASGQMRPYVEALVRLSITTPGAWEALAPDLAAAPMSRERMDTFFQEELPRNDLAPRLGEVACPALVVAGRDDALCTPRAAKEMAKGLLRARLDVLPGGHWPWVEAPAEFRASLASWLGTLDGEPGERA
jgi:pimeloyl-ACP methyl ester carboxylesterase